MSIRSLAIGIALACLGIATAACGGDSSTGSDPIDPDTSTVTDPPTADAVTTTAPASSTVVTAAPTSTTPTVVPLFEFTSIRSADGWSVVNDTVMGGVSSGELALEDGALVFTGELSLDNNGGFASVRSPLIDQQLVAAWADRVGPGIQVQGDGRTWTVEVRTDEMDGGWIATLPTSADSVTDVTLPWASFEPVSRFLDPRDAAAPLDPSRIVSIAFYLVDGIEGPFRLAIREIG